MSLGLIILCVILSGLLITAWRQRLPPAPVAKRALEQFLLLVPRMICALVAAGFVAELLPSRTIAQFLGPEAGLLAIPVAAVTGVLLPSGPVIAFAVAAVFAKSGATPAALVTFVTSWSLFAMHRVFIYELPILGASFLRLRLVSVALLPFIAGGLAMLLGLATAIEVSATAP